MILIVPMLQIVGKKPIHIVILLIPICEFINYEDIEHDNNVQSNLMVFHRVTVYIIDLLPISRLNECSNGIFLYTPEHRYSPLSFCVTSFKMRCWSSCKCDLST